jgi:AcrR family transcriptional regulator
MPKIPAKSGRPMSFDKATALRSALHLFWSKGYEATSLADLTTAMGITPPSLYNAFGGKEQLFAAALDLYIADTSARSVPILANAVTAREAVRQLLELRARVQSGLAAIADTDGAAASMHCAQPHGCMLIASANNGSAAPPALRARVADLERHGEQCLTARIAQGIRDGDVPPGEDAAALAAYYVAVIDGMATLARGGASLQRLRDIAALAMRCWPTSASIPA